jgi:hypothetical protein
MFIFGGYRSSVFATLVCRYEFLVLRVDLLPLLVLVNRLLFHCLFGGPLRGLRADPRSLLVLLPSTLLDNRLLLRLFPFRYSSFHFFRLLLRRMPCGFGG